LGQKIGNIYLATDFSIDKKNNHRRPEKSESFKIMSKW